MILATDGLATNQADEQPRGRSTGKEAGPSLAGRVGQATDARRAHQRGG